jgi:hypothetical protein
MKDTVQAIAADMRAAMVNEVRALAAAPVPDGAMSFEELRAETGMSRDMLHRLVSKKIASGEWKRGRVGLGVKYWKVSE